MVACKGGGGQAGPGFPGNRRAAAKGLLREGGPGLSSASVTELEGQNDEAFRTPHPRVRHPALTRPAVLQAQISISFLVHTRTQAQLGWLAFCVNSCRCITGVCTQAVGTPDPPLLALHYPPLVSPTWVLPLALLAAQGLCGLPSLYLRHFSFSLHQGPPQHCLGHVPSGGTPAGPAPRVQVLGCWPAFVAVARGRSTAKANCL